MLATKDNWRDIQKYYQNTFVKLAELGEVPLHVDKVTPESIFFVNIDGEKIELQLCNEGYDLNYCIPKKTVFQLGSQAYIVERIPARMWRKGWSSENSQISYVAANGEIIVIPWGIELAQAFVNKQQYPRLWDFTKGLAVFDSIALNSRFYCYKTDYHYICADGAHCGRVDIKTGTIYYRSIFNKEFQTLFDGQGFNLVGVGA